MPSGGDAWCGEGSARTGAIRPCPRSDDTCRTRPGSFWRRAPGRRSAPGRQAAQRRWVWASGHQCRAAAVAAAATIAAATPAATAPQMGATAILADRRWGLCRTRGNPARYAPSQERYVGTRRSTAYRRRSEAGPARPEGRHAIDEAAMARCRDLRRSWYRPVRRWAWSSSAEGVASVAKAGGTGR
jgi:hypothetical protein